MAVTGADDIAASFGLANYGVKSARVVVVVRRKHRGEGVLLANRQGARSKWMRWRLRRRICELGIGQSNSPSGKSPSVEVSRIADHLHVDDGCEPVWSGV
jgi:hypothetical protein